MAKATEAILMKFIHWPGGGVRAVCRVAGGTDSAGLNIAQPAGSCRGQPGRRRHHHFRQRMRQFAFRHDHAVGAVFHEVLDFGIAVRARQQGQRRIQGAQLDQRFSRFQRLRDGEDGDARLFRLRFGQHVVGGGTAADAGDAGRVRARHVIGVVVDDEDRHAAIAQQPGQRAAHAAVTDDDGVRVQVERRARRSLLRWQRRFGDPARLPAREPGEHERVGDDRQQGAGEDQVVPLLRQQALGEAEAGEDEGELADLRQADGDRQCGGGRQLQQAHDREGDAGVAEDDDVTEQAAARKLADIVIENNGTLEELHAAVGALYNDLLTETTKPNYRAV